MGVSRSLRCVRGFPAPLLALCFAACATGTEPAATDEDGGSAGTALAGALGSGAPGGGRGGSPSGGLSGSANGGAGSGGKAVFAGSGGAGAGSGGAQSGSGGNVSGSSGTGGASGGAGSSGKAGTSGMGGAGGVGGMNAGTGGMNAGTGGMNAGTGGMNGGAGGGCSNPVAKIEHSASAMVTAADCVELTHKASWTSVNVVITSQPGTMGYPITFRYGSCRTSGTGSFTRDYEAKALYKGENPNCSLFVQFEGAKSSALVFVHYD